ncbi:MAG: KH domain-containing protein [Actinobacteria bacterium]|nr:KH domain-containing protein [Actinomycetota bacterium]
MTDGPDNAGSVLEYLVRSIVDTPEAVEVDMVAGNPDRYDVRVADGDMGRVIGRRGHTADAIRTVVRAAAARSERAVDVEFVD